MEAGRVKQDHSSADDSPIITKKTPQITNGKASATAGDNESVVLSVAEHSTTLMMRAHEGVGSVMPPPSAEAIEAAATVYKFGMRKFGANAFMNIQMARFYWVYRANPHKMAMALQVAFALKPLPDYGMVCTVAPHFVSISGNILLLTVVQKH